ncbi:MAG: GNAT family N-acetyltransferase [Eubacteriales bacterium]|nr:GNAT family N-acetyltransferase [Eubacteriales bacterium]
MDVRLLGESEIPSAKALWKEAFGDSDAFIGWYFQNKVLPGASIGLFDGGLVSVVHMLPYKLRIQGRPFQTAFIAGAATSKRRQGEGHMRTLLLEALALMKQRGILMTHLYPFDHSFYENFGWAAYSYAHKISATEAKGQRGAKVIETTDAQELSPLYEKMMRSMDGYVIRDGREWRWRLEELGIDGGKAAVLMKNDMPAAYTLYYADKGKADVIETVFSDKEDIETLLAYILGQGAGRADYFIPAQNSGTKFGMARIVDAEALLAAFGAEALLAHVSLVDDFAKWNNIGGGGKAMHIGALAKIIHQGVLVDKPGDAAEKYFHEGFKQIFIRQNTCIFETY